MEKTVSKRLFSIMLALLVTIMCLPAFEFSRASAATSYELVIAGKQVTSDNASDVLGNGVFSYNAATKTLLINKDYTGSGTTNLIYSAVNDLTIKTAKALTLDSGAATNIYVTGSATIQTSGLLTLKSKKFGVYVGSSTASSEIVLTVKESDLDISGGERGITGYGKNEKLSVVNSNITANGTSGAVCTFENAITLENCEITSPEGAIITKPEGKRSYSVYESGGKIAAKSVSIIGRYGLYVGGKQVTYLNRSDVLGDGNVSYDSLSKTLTLNGDVNVFSQYGVLNENIQGLTVKVANGASLYGKQAGISSKCDMTITGPELLSISGSDMPYGVQMDNNAKLTIDGADIYVSANTSALYGGGKTSKLEIVNSVVSAYTNNSVQGAVSGFGGGITFERCKLSTPNGAVVKNGAICTDDGTTKANNVRIAPDYELYIAGTAVTAKNADDILGDGAFSYDTQTNQLTILKDFASEETIVDNHIDGLTIKTLGPVKLTSTNDNVISTEGSLTIKTGGKLTVSAANTGIFVNSGDKSDSAKLTIQQGSELEISAKYAIMGGLEKESLAVIDSKVTAKAAVIAVCDFQGGIELVDCKLAQPQEAVISGGTVCENDGRTKARNVVIEPIDKYEIYVGSVQVTEKNSDDVLGDGKVSFDSTTNTLTFNDPTVTGSTSVNNALSVSASGLGKELIVKGKLNVPNGNVKFDNCKFVGFDLDCATLSGKLTHKSGSVNVGQSVSDCDITVDGTYFTAAKLNDGKLTVNGGTVKVTELDAALTVNGGTFSGKISTVTDNVVIKGGSTAVNADAITSVYGNITINDAVVNCNGNIQTNNGNITINSGEITVNGYIRSGNKLAIGGNLVRLEAEAHDLGAAISANGELTIASSSSVNNAVIKLPENGKIGNVNSRFAVVDVNGNTATHVVIAPENKFRLDNIDLGNITPAAGEKAKHAQDIGLLNISDMTCDVEWFIDENGDETADELDIYNESYYLPNKTFEDCTSYSVSIHIDLSDNDKRELADTLTFSAGGLKPVTVSVEQTQTGQCAEAVLTFISRPHSLEQIPGKAATCCEQGYKKYWKCENCGKLFSDSVGDNQISEPIAIPIDPFAHRFGEWSLVSFDFKNSQSVYTRICSICNTAQTRTEKDAAKRFDGANRYETAVKISSESGKFTTANTVILAYGLNYADALAGVPLAKALNAPILLTTTNMIPEGTVNEIKRLGASNVIILGGEGVISEKVEDQLESYGLKTDRIGGKNRYDTAVQIAEKLNPNPTEIFFVYGLNFADALSVSTVAAIKDAPILYLTTDGKIPEATEKYLATVKGKVKKAYVIGGDGVISKNMMGNAANALGLTVDVDVTRVSGANRYETCVEINTTFASVLTGNSICVATGLDFPDALAGGVLAAVNKAPLLLADLNLRSEQIKYLKSKKTDSIYIFGGTGAVKDGLADEIGKASVLK